MTSARFTIRSARETDWQQYRDLRLEMLADSPLAFCEKHADAKVCSEVEWEDALMVAAEEWAAQHGPQLFLQVHEHNPRAIAFYQRHGYELTGEAEPYLLNPSEVEREMVKTF